MTILDEFFDHSPPILPTISQKTRKIVKSGGDKPTFKYHQYSRYIVTKDDIAWQKRMSKWLRNNEL